MKNICVILFLLMSLGVMAMDYTVLFDRKEYEKVPKVYPSHVKVMGKDSWKYEGILTKEEEREADKSNNYIKPVMYEGPVCEGKETRVFAWIGVPPCEDGKKVPAMVLIHGGGGTAFEAWVRLWNARGYAAIAMDTCGCVPEGEYGKWHEHDRSGHTSWGGAERVNLNLKDQWPYQAAMEVLLGTSLLASYPQVDRTKIGISGISWGGWLTCICASVDQRFAFAHPVYGCGHQEFSVYRKLALKSSLEEKDYYKWISIWDPKNVMKNIKIPIHFMVGLNDQSFWTRSQKASMDECSAFSFMHYKENFPHDHGEHGECQPESKILADYYLKGGEKFIGVKTQLKDGILFYETDKPAKSVCLLWTDDINPGPKSKWNRIEGDMTSKSVAVPQEAESYFLNAEDENGTVTTGEMYFRNELTDKMLKEMTEEAKKNEGFYAG